MTPVSTPHATASTPASAHAAPTTSTGHRWDFDLLRILAILGVVAIHVFGLILGSPELKGTSTWTFAVVLDIGSTWCVPIFVMLSGALLLDPRAHRAGPGAFLRRRAVRLLPAVVVWHLVYLVVVRKVLLESELDPSTVAVNFIDGKVYTALYFLWLILGLYLVAPVLAAFLGGDTRRARVVAVLACLWCAAVVTLPVLAGYLGFPRARVDTLVTMFVPYIGLFVAGYAWREPRRSGLRWVAAGVVAAALVAFNVLLFLAGPSDLVALLKAVVPINYATVPTVVASIALFLFVIDLCARLDPPAPVRRVLQTLGNATFGVFLVHLVFVAIVRRWSPDFYADPAPVAKTQLYLLVVVASFATSVVAARIPLLRRVF